MSPVLAKARKGAPWRQPASQPSLIVNFQANERPHLKTKVNEIQTEIIHMGFHIRTPPTEINKILKTYPAQTLLRARKICLHSAEGSMLSACCASSHTVRSDLSREMGSGSILLNFHLGLRFSQTDCQGVMQKTARH